MRNTPKILTYIVIVIVIVMEVPPPIKLLPGERLWKIEVNHALWSGGLFSRTLLVANKWGRNSTEGVHWRRRREGPVNLFGRTR